MGWIFRREVKLPAFDDACVLKGERHFSENTSKLDSNHAKRQIQIEDYLNQK